MQIPGGDGGNGRDIGERNDDQCAGGCGREQAHGPIDSPSLPSRPNERHPQQWQDDQRCSCRCDDAFGIHLAKLVQPMP